MGAERTMGRHFIHYYRRQLLTRFPDDPDDPFYTEFQPPEAGVEKPSFHVTRSERGAAAEVCPNDTIWLVSQLYSSWGSLPPALDARIEVAARDRRPRGCPGYRYEAAATSRWFPLLDCSNMLQKIKTINKAGEIRNLQKDPAQPIGYSLQSMRELESAVPLISWEKKLESKRRHFISYRVVDGSHDAFDLAKSMISDRQQIFWDRWSLPRRLAERRELISDAALDAYLEDRIREADVVWGIETKQYAAASSYSLKEQCLAKDLGTYRRVAALYRVP